MRDKTSQPPRREKVVLAHRTVQRSSRPISTLPRSASMYVHIVNCEVEEENTERRREREEGSRSLLRCVAFAFALALRLRCVALRYVTLRRVASCRVGAREKEKSCVHAVNISLYRPRPRHKTRLPRTSIGTGSAVSSAADKHTCGTCGAQRRNPPVALSLSLSRRSTYTRSTCMTRSIERISHRFYFK